MKKAAFSVLVDGILLEFIGTSLVFLPALFLKTLGFTVCDDLIVPRVLGLLVAILGAYYMVIAIANVRVMIVFTVVGRLAFFLGSVVFFLANWTGPNIFLISMIDLIGSIWTLIALKSDAKVQ
ncbi:MAG: hypothetical protein PHS94_09850 [Erysipelotrichaceae bacterium]|nr:hypothetical protein [Erysipelotrichaceae bacterium]